MTDEDALDAFWAALGWVVADGELERECVEALSHIEERLFRLSRLEE